MSLQKKIVYTYKMLVKKKFLTANVFIQGWL